MPRQCSILVRPVSMRGLLSAVAMLALTALPQLAAATLCCVPSTNTCTVQTGGSCPGGTFTIPGTTCTPNVCSASWVAGPFSSCSTTCGPGTQTRTVVCMIGSTTVPDAACVAAGTKPATTQACNNGSCTAMWMSGAWSLCSQACGPGTQTRTVVCMDGGVTVPDSTCSAAGAKPATSQACNNGSCTAAWVVGSWSTCSVPCGGGTQTRSVVCMDGGVTVPDSTCSAAGTKPATSQACNTTACLVPQWSVGAWGACSAPCGGGTQSRIVLCVDATSGTTLGDTSCTLAVGPKPATSQACNTVACTGACCVGATCSTLTPAACTTAAGRYTGNLIACNPSGNFVTPCCFANFDGVNGLQVADIFAFLNAWFAGSPTTNIDGVGGLQVADIFAFLNAWFAGC